MLLAAYLYNLDGYPLLDPDEGRNAEVAREMAERNDYLLPHLNGLPYLDKPVLYFAAVAAAIEMLGPTVLAVRLPSLVFTLGTLALVAWFGRRLYGPDGAWTAALATAATPFTLAYSRTVIFDSALTFWVVAALVSFYLAVEAPNRGPHSRAPTWRALAWAAMAFGVLTKGPIALAFPLLIATPYAWWRRRARQLVDPLAALLFLALVLPWVFGVSQEVPGFLHYALVTETAVRLTTPALDRTGPLWYFLAILPAAALPWSLVAMAGWRSLERSRLREPAIVLLVLWIVVPLLLFTLSQSKRPQYVLPVVPAVGLLAAALWHRGRGRMAGARFAAGGVAVLGLGCLAGHRLASRLVAASSTIAAEIPTTATVLGAACLVGAAGAWLGARRRELVLFALSIPVATVPLASGDLMDAIGAERSSEEIAQTLASVMTPSTQVVGVQAFPLSLPFYLRRRLLVSTADGSELTSNYLTRHFEYWIRAPGSPLRDRDWWREAASRCLRPTVFVVAATDQPTRAFLGGHLPLLIESRKYAAYGPCGTGALAEQRGRAAPVAAVRGVGP